MAALDAADLGSPAPHRTHRLAAAAAQHAVGGRIPHPAGRAALGGCRRDNAEHGPRDGGAARRVSLRAGAAHGGETNAACSPRYTRTRPRRAASAPQQPQGVEPALVGGPPRAAALARRHVRHAGRGGCRGLRGAAPPHRSGRRRPVAVPRRDGRPCPRTAPFGPSARRAPLRGARLRRGRGGLRLRRRRQPAGHCGTIPSGRATSTRGAPRWRRRRAWGSSTAGATT